MTIVHDAFERPAKFHATAVGMPELPMVIVPQRRISFDSEKDYMERAEKAAPAIIEALTRPVPASQRH